MIYCDHCWAENGRDAVLCVACGTDLTQPRGDMVERMIRALRHPLPDWRAFAADWLGRSDDERTLPALCSVAQSLEAQDDLDPLPAIAGALGQLGRPSGTDTLVRLARHPFLGGRASAVKALAVLRTWEARDEVGLAAKSDPSAAVRECAKEALRAGGHEHERTAKR